MKPESTQETSDIDLTDAELYRGGFPHDIFTRLRAEAPVWWHPVPDDFTTADDTGFWVLSKYDDVQAANRDTERFSALDGPSLSHRPEMSGTMLVSMEGAQHARQRRLISAGFTPRMIGELEEKTRRWAVSIVDDAVERGTVEFVDDVAYQLPMHMIADIVGIPLDDRASLFQLTKDLLAGGDPSRNVSEEEKLAVQVQMFGYAQQLGEAKRKHPSDDVWTILSTAEVEAEDGTHTSLDPTELDMFFLLLTIAGSETTRNAIASGLVALVENPDQLEQVRREPAAMRGAVEEILRWASPVSYFARRATEDVEIRGVRIRAGERVTLWYPSANRDEDVFEDPFRFDINRPHQDHVAFGGGGPHFCLGANLARREITILLEELLRRTSDIEILGPPVYATQGIFNPVCTAMAELPVRLTAA